MSAISDRLRTIFSRFDQLKIVMLGDFFLDQYLDLAREYSETSLETGLEAYQVTRIRNSLGAAGTVANNLRAMTVNVLAVGMIGDDSNGKIIKELMREQGIDAKFILEDEDIFTPTYIKPMMVEVNGEEHELNRIDIKNRLVVSPELETRLIERLQAVTFDAHAILVTDQVQEAGCGVLTDGMRKALSLIGQTQPELPIWVDSRERSNLFEHVSLKMNLSELKRSFPLSGNLDDMAEDGAKQLHQLNLKPVLVTDGENGIAYCYAQESGLVPALKMNPPLDIVGAGDSVLAAAGSAIAAGATLREAALIGCLAASVTIKKLGTTGTASIEEMMANLHIFEEQNPDFVLG